MFGGHQETPTAPGALPLPGAHRTPVVTSVILAVNAVLWLLMTVAGGSTNPDVLLRFGAMFGPYIAAGEYWRLFTAMFLHVGILHLLLNSFGLLIFGRMLERLFGHTRFFTVYVISGLAGSTTSFMFNAAAVGAGASGAIFGILGALAAFFAARRDILGAVGRQNLYGILLLAGINLFIGLTTPRIDNWAHIGGFVAGMALGYVLAPEYRILRDPLGMPYGLRDVNSLLRRWWVLPLSGLVLALGVSLASRTLPENPLTHVYKAERLVDEGRYEEALDQIEAALVMDRTVGRAYYLRARVLSQWGDVDGAIADLAKAMLTGDPETREEARQLLAELLARRR